MVNTAIKSLRKRVSFVSAPQSPLSESSSSDSGSDHSQQVSSHSCHCFCDGLDKQERKQLCWYSLEDLQPCREEAKDAIQQLQQSLEQGTLDSLPEDVCLRGIEKYADASGKYRKQRIYIESVLQQHQALQQRRKLLNKSHDNDDVENLANLSRYLSQASTELALYYARRCAAELSLLRHEEEDEEEDDDDEEFDGQGEEEKYVLDTSSTCSQTSEIDVHESKADNELCPDSTISVSSKRKRSRCHDTSLPPRKIQCCE